MHFLTIASSVAMALSVFMSSVAAAPAYTTPNLEKLKKIMPTGGLPVPGDLQLKFVGLGIGTQNYTCLTGDPAAEPGTTGAVAKLYDIGSRLVNDPFAKGKISTLSGLALQFHNSIKAIEIMLRTQGYECVLGDHFFTQATPTFSLNKIPTSPQPLLFVKKNTAVDAPKNSFPGVKGEGAIQWLHLIDNGSSQGGVNTVYRIETAGGSKPKTCKDKPQTFNVPYVAQYWVYGPRA